MLLNSSLLQLSTATFFQRYLMELGPSVVAYGIFLTYFWGSNGMAQITREQKFRARQQEQAEGTRASHKERENQIVRWRHFTSRSDTVALARLREAGMSAGCVVQLSLRLPCAAVGEFLQEALLKLGLIWREKRGQDNKKLAEEEPGHEEGSVLVGLKLHLRSHESPQITHKWPRSLKADGHHADSTSPICAVQC
ncbi:uncharacterized protein LOC125333098 isoform X1 [Corvus hawaiiensis]|uniref:uncharacterized protein LOC125333098 isoform X1 n=1 Tax=Corvus hawaiiensis TaxID=134902 RepID=UPI002019D842|nr:uncharacterized protein LOC125333098 isoform X1 [Corvus hawaiiensis]XP_048174672.1 uncharacterized protein LOC125333098 isoform X1 [Corvus hawaiiensis]XP_048174673.1 uncharacterized protein LOC125333098 isoform X1 [Corvus hawaiiensis]